METLLRRRRDDVAGVAREIPAAAFVPAMSRAMPSTARARGLA
ncbi:MAG TPA: hypothetical protein VK001_12060 [Geminicoccaceae bacterium]|nr:hypothetical protein [Geminicoccaceae bacterium]